MLPMLFHLKQVRYTVALVPWNIKISDTWYINTAEMKKEKKKRIEFLKKFENNLRFWIWTPINGAMWPGTVQTESYDGIMNYCTL